MINFNQAIEAFKKRDFDTVSTFIEQGNPPMQFLENNLIEVELIYLVSYYSALDNKIISHLNSNPDINQTTDDELKYTAVHIAAWDGKGEILKYLIDKGANPDVRGLDGYTALHLAASNGRKDCVRILFEAGAEISTRVIDENIFFPVRGATPFRLSFFNGFFDISEYLYLNGADVIEICEPCNASHLKHFSTVDIVRRLGVENEIHNFSHDEFEKVVKLFFQNFQNPFVDNSNLNNSIIDKLKRKSVEFTKIDYPAIYWINQKPEQLDNLKKYSRLWQGKSTLYKNVTLKGVVPNFISELFNANSPPILTNKESLFISQQISSNKIIPVLSYAPDDCHSYVKQVWWLIPFCIWKEEIVSYVFIDKNGFYAPVPKSNKAEPEIKMIFSWDSLIDLVFEKDFDSSNLNRLTLRTKSGYLTLDEFTKTSTKNASIGSYLSVVASIWKVRRETIEKSEGKPFWIEGSGGEGFKYFENHKDLLDSSMWTEPHRPNPILFS